MMKFRPRHFFKNYVKEREVRQDMDGQEISGRLIRPDGTEQYWWNGVNNHNVIPEELIDAVLAAEKNKKERKK